MKSAHSRSSMVRWRTVAVAVALVGGVSHALNAQDSAEPARWRFSVTPYIWMSGLEGRIGVGSNISDVDVAFTEGAEDFEFGFAALGEARRHAWVVRTDFFYVSLSDDGATSAGHTLTVGQNELMFHPEVGYTLLARPWGGVDGLVGARYWNLGVDLSGPSEKASVDRSWVDGTVGANLRYQLGQKWRFVAKADIGAGGSNHIWQLYGGVGYDIAQRWALVAAWRYLDIDYEQEGLLYDVRLGGPTIGVTLRF